jgi:hypothetical protein
MFQELGSALAPLVAREVCDMYGLLNHRIIERADATQAYTQSLLGGTPTWVSLPKEEWPESWKHMGRLVCPMEKAFYGHPDAGGYWEQHCDRLLQDCGFDPIVPTDKSWRSCYYSKSFQCYMIVYADDFKFAGPPDNVRKAWQLMQEPNPRTKERGLILDEPSPAGKFLGFNHICHEIDRPPMSVDHKTGVTSLAPEVATLAGGNHVSADAMNNAGDHITTKAVRNPVPIPTRGSLYSSSGYDPISAN